MFYIYHIPGKKIGVTRNLNNRVTLVQGYKPDEYEVLDSSEDIDYISEKVGFSQYAYLYFCFAHAIYTKIEGYVCL